LIFLKILKDYTAGNPMHSNILWTNLTCVQISQRLKENYIIAGTYVVKQLLKKCGYVKRKMFKNRTMKIVDNRNEQFLYISELKKEFTSNNWPSLSMDSKKKETLGNYYREGKLYTKAAINVKDHDFREPEDGIVIPHGLYDENKNKCYLTIGKSKDTAEFVCDNLEYHWNNSIKKDYPDAKKILLLCDGGGSNSCLHYVVKEQLYKLSERLQIEIVVAHYPAYCSKWNPIEHKAFCHITRSWQGVEFESYEIIKELAEATTTKTGFSVKASINDKIYETGKKSSAEFLETMPVHFDKFLPKWNYSFKPNLL
jgi:hypothetical protein